MLFGGTRLLQCSGQASDAGVTGDAGCLCWVLRTGFDSSQVRRPPCCPTLPCLALRCLPCPALPCLSCSNIPYCPAGLALSHEPAWCTCICCWLMVPQGQMVRMIEFSSEKVKSVSFSNYVLPCSHSLPLSLQVTGNTVEALMLVLFLLIFALSARLFLGSLPMILLVSSIYLPLSVSVSLYSLIHTLPPTVYINVCLFVYHTPFVCLCMSNTNPSVAMSSSAAWRMAATSSTCCCTAFSSLPASYPRVCRL